jgi:hypothetical protein
VERAHQDIVKMSENIHTVLESTRVFSPSGGAMRWLHKDVKIISKLSEINRLWVTEDRFSPFKRINLGSSNLDENWGLMGPQSNGNGNGLTQSP